MIDHIRYFNMVGVSTNSLLSNTELGSFGFLLEIAIQNTLRVDDDIAPQKGLRLAKAATMGSDDFLAALALWESLRWTDSFPINTIFLLGEIFLQGVAAVISAPYRWSISKFRRPDGYHFGWLPLVLVTGAVNLFVAQPLFFLGNVCNHVRGLVGGVLRFGWGVLKGSYKAFRAPQGEGWRLFRNAVKPGLGEVIGNSLRLLGDAVVGGLCYGISVLTGGVAAPFLVPAASAIQSSFLSATAVQVSTTAGMLAAQGAASQVVSLSVSAKIRAWVVKKFKVSRESRQLAAVEPQNISESRNRENVTHPSDLPNNSLSRGQPLPSKGRGVGSPSDNASSPHSPGFFPRLREKSLAGQERQLLEGSVRNLSP